MRTSNLVESLESRQLLAAQLTVGPNNMYFNAVKGQTQTYTLRIINSGDTRVTINRLAFAGENKDRWTVTDFPAGGRSIGVGGQVNYTVKFTAPSSSTAIQTGTLRVYTDSIPTKNGFSNIVNLRGMATNGTSGSSEPSLQKIFNLYGLPIKTGQTDPENYKFPTNPTGSDEINAQTFVKAGDGNVTITPIGVFTNNTSPAIRTGYYTPGDPSTAKFLWYVPGDTSQSVNPYYYGTTKFDPGSAEFGIISQYPAFQDRTTGLAQNIVSEDALNAVWSDSSSYDHFRVYPFINQAGEVVENSYIVAQEEYYVTSQADNNDGIFVITNVKPVGTATPTLSVQNVSALPDNNTLVFNKIQIPNADVGNLVRTQNSVKIRNTGTAPLTISLNLDGSDYSIASGGGSGTIAPGGSREVKINFNATSGTAIHYGTLTITSNDPSNPTEVVNLVGNWQQYSEQNGQGAPSVEPSAQTIVNKIFGYTSDVPTPNELKTLSNKVQATGDQITAQYFVAADSGADARVFVTEIAAFHNQTYTATNGDIIATNSYMGWYKKGSPSSNKNFLTDKAGTGQMILPTNGSANNTGTATSSFKPGTGSFGFTVERKDDGSSGEYSDHSLNIVKDKDGNVVGTGQFLRFYIAKDKNGVVIPNTYIMLHDYNRPGITNFDFNDTIYLISNVIPENQIKVPPVVSAVRQSGVLLNWSSPVDGPKITGFNVYRSTAVDGVYSLLTGTPLTARPSMVIRDDGATSTAPYYYAIESVGPSGKSDRVIVKV